MSGTRQPPSCFQLLKYDTRTTELTTQRKKKKIKKIITNPLVSVAVRLVLRLKQTGVMSGTWQPPSCF
jgi:hypothetical protein